MMLAYNKNELQNTFLKEQARQLSVSGFIGKQQFEFIRQNLVTLHTSRNFIVRTGFFILGLIFCMCGAGALALFTSAEHFAGTFLLVVSLLSFGVLEIYYIHQKKYYRHGLDKAFLFFAQLCLVSATQVIRSRFSVDLFFISVAIVGLLCLFRYSDKFSLFASVTAIVALIARFVLLSSYPAGFFLPIAAILSGAGLIYGGTRISSSQSENYPFLKELMTLYGTTIIYLGTNIFVLRMLIADYSSVRFSAVDIIAPWLFVFSTIVSPLLILISGLFFRQRSLIWLGFAAAAFSAYSIRYFYQVAPIEWVMLIGGVFIFALAWFAMKKLSGKQSGLSWEPDPLVPAGDISEAEILALLEQSRLNAPTVNTTGADPGGGSFGGGGSGGNY